MPICPKQGELEGRGDLAGMGEVRGIPLIRDVAALLTNSSRLLAES